MKTKRLFAFLLAVVMVLSVAMPAFAANTNGTAPDDGSITIMNPQEGQTYKAYKVFDLSFVDTNVSDTDNYPYTYFLDASSPWKEVVEAYANTAADPVTGTHGAGLVLDPVYAADGKTVRGYNITALDDDVNTKDVDEGFSAAKFAAYLKENIPTDALAKEFTDGVADGLEYGYYIVISSKDNVDAKLAMLTSTDPQVKIYDKNEMPKVDKVIVDDPTAATEYAKKGDPTYTAYELFAKSVIAGNGKISWGKDINGAAFSTEANKIDDLVALFNGLDYKAPAAGDGSDDAAFKWYGVYTDDAADDFITAATKSGVITGEGKDAFLNLNGGSLYIVKKVTKAVDPATEDTVEYKIFNVTADGPLFTADTVEDTFYKKPEISEVPAETKPSDSTNEFDHNTASVGETVNYKLTTKVPDMTGYEKYFFVVNDTMTKGLTFDGADSVKITMTKEGVTGSPKTFILDKDYSVKESAIKNDKTGEPETEVRIVFNDMVSYWSNDPTKDWTDAEIVIEYSATVNQDAVTEVINFNTAFIEFSDDPSIVPEHDPEDPTDPDNDPNDPRDPGYEWNDPDYTGDDPVGEGPEDSTYTFVANILLTKVDGDSNALTGAKFSIQGTAQKVVLVNKDIFIEDATDGTYYRLKNGTYTTVAPSQTDKYTLIEDDFERKEYKEVTEAAAIGLYYKDITVTGTADPYVLIDDDNLDKIPENAKIFQLVYKNLGLYFVSDNKGTAATDDDVYTVVDKANADKHLEDDLYEKTIIDTIGAYEDGKTKYRKVTEINESNNDDSYVAEGWVDKDGKLSFGGLGAGTYEITELVAPDGYNILTTPITLVVEFEYNETTPADSTFSAKLNGGNVSYDKDTGTLSFNVVNNKGIELPETGGMGTVLFIAIGAVLFMAAGIILTTKKRLYNEG